jgi:hypothetical protein
MPVKKLPELRFPVEQIMVLCAAAHRINGGYVKRTSENYIENTGVKMPNVEMVKYLMKREDLITDADREHGNTVLEYFRSLFITKILAHESGDAFTALTEPAYKPQNSSYLGYMETNTLNFNIYCVIKEDTMTLPQLSMVAFLPQSYERDLKRSQEHRRLNDAIGNYVGNVGDRVKLTVRVLYDGRLSKFGEYNHEAITDENQIVGFSSKNQFNRGDTFKLESKVKTHHTNGKTYLGGRGSKQLFFKINGEQL